MPSGDFEIPDLGTTPLIFGPPDVVEGYHILEAMERNLQLEPINRHPDSVLLWYRLLTLLHPAFAEGFEVADGTDEEVDAFQARAEFLALGLASSKASLDLLLTGYYSPAYAVIRHMIETVLLCRYTEMTPRHAAAVYSSQSDTGHAHSHLPKTQTMVTKLKKTYPNERRRFDHL